MLLAIAGKFPGDDYTDARHSSPADAGDLTQNLGRMPVLENNGETIGQSAAINNYLANELGLNGSNHLEAARIVSIFEHLKELNTAYRAIMPWGAEPTEEGLDKWFNTGATDATGVADGANRSTRHMAWWLARIEATLGNHGYAVGNKLSVADVMLFFFFGDNLSPEVHPETPAWKREVFYSKERTDAAIAQHPKIAASVRAVAENANIQKWLSVRGHQAF